jgi:hypothetical protein
MKEHWRKSVNKNEFVENDITKNIKKKSSKTTENDITEISWKRNCPSCQKELTYKRKHSRDNSEKHNRLCWSCRNSGKNNPFYGKHHTEEHKKYISDLAPSRRPHVKQKISTANRGRLVSENTKQILREKAIQQFSTEESRKTVSERIRMMYEENPSMREVARNKAIQQYARYKQTDGYKEWLSKKSEYELYKMEVMRLTFENDLTKLENWSKRNLYHLYEIDHIYPISRGFKNNIPAQLIGNINNLQIIPRKENRSKSDKILIIPEHIKEFIGERL